MNHALYIFVMIFFTIGGAVATFFGHDEEGAIYVIGIIALIFGLVLIAISPWTLVAQ